MLDIKFIRENKKIVEKNNKTRQVKADVGALLSLDEERIALQQKADELRAERNKRSKTKPSPEEIKAIRQMGGEISELENKVKIFIKEEINAEIEKARKNA